jgi:hypothetical protein
VTTYRALIVCNANYPDDPANLPRLNGPQADGLLLWRALVDPLTGVAKQCNVRVLFEETSGEITTAAESLFGSAEPNEVVLLYFSGHGRKVGKDLILCSRNSVVSHIRATGVPSSMLNAMIEDCRANAVIVLLDCCNAGNFKGGNEKLGEPLEGEGRFVYGAVAPGMLAPDSKNPYSGSPFTEALVEGMTGAAKDSNGDGSIDLEDVARYVDSRFSRTSRPYKSNTGMGSVSIARRPGSDTDPHGPTASQDLGLPVKPVGEPLQPTSSWLSAMTQLRPRKLGDFSLADLRAYQVIASLGLVAVCAGAAAFIGWPLLDDNDPASIDPARNTALALIAICLLQVLLALGEGLILRKSSKPLFRRRSLQLAQSAPARRLRAVRHVVAYLGGLLVFSGLAGVVNYNPSWSISLTCAGALALMAVAIQTRQGDQSYLIAALLVLLAAFFPPNGISERVFRSDSHFGLIMVGAAVLMLLAWWVKLPRLIYFLPPTVALLALISVIVAPLAAGVAPYIAMVGAALGLISCLMGAGVALSVMEDSPLVLKSLNRDG